MAGWIQDINTILSIATIFLQGGLVVTCILFLSGSQNVRVLVQRGARPAAFLLSFGALVGSLVYSNIIGYEPCDLCWYQRIFLYPLVLVLGVSLLKKDRAIADYVLALAIPGALIAGYHYYGQMIDTSVLTCAAATVSCAQRFFVEFNYITMPLMSLTIFVCVIALMIGEKKVIEKKS